MLREADQALSKEIAHAARLAGVAGQSYAIRTILNSRAPWPAPQPCRADRWGKRGGSGRTTPCAPSIHALGKRRGPAIVPNARTGDGRSRGISLGAEPRIRARTPQRRDGKPQKRERSPPPWRYAGSI